MKYFTILSLSVFMSALIITGCISAPPEGLAPAPSANTTVRFDFEAKPLPEIPLPNDIATRYDETSPTKRRLNASKIAPTDFESLARRHIDTLDGWGVGQPITIPFTGPLDVRSILAGHRDVDYDPFPDPLPDPLSPYTRPCPARAAGASARARCKSALKSVTPSVRS